MTMVNATEGWKMSKADQVKQIIAEQLGKDEDEISLDALFMRDLGADSLDLSECIVAFEQTFKIQISPEDAAELKTLRDAIAYIEANGRPAAG
jgi:acyl carrier protein